MLAGRTITVAWSFLVVSPLDPLAGAEDKLRDIRSVTDAALWYLGADDLLAELLTRVKQILDADTVAVLLLASSGRQLIATAASGLQEEVRQGVRARWAVTGMTCSRCPGVS